MKFSKLCIADIILLVATQGLWGILWYVTEGFLDYY